MKKILEVNDQEIQWLLMGLDAGQHENLIPSQGEYRNKVLALEKRLDELLKQKKSNKNKKSTKNK